MDTTDILKSLEDPKPAPEQPKIQLDLAQLQGALILIQDAMATQQRQIAELNKTVGVISKTLDNNNSDTIKMLDGIPNRINNVYSKAVSTLCQVVEQKTAADNSSAESVKMATKELQNAQIALKSTSHGVTKASETIRQLFDANKDYALTLYIEHCLHYVFLILFTVWLVYGQYKPWGNFVMIGSTLLIVSCALLSKMFLRRE